MSMLPAHKTLDPVLVVGPSWVGDMVMAQSLFKVLKRLNGKRPIDVLAPPWSHGLLARMPEVREIIPLGVSHGALAWGVRRTLGRELRATGYGQAIVLPNSFKSALTPWWAKIPVRTGYVGEFRYPLLNDCRTLDTSVLTRLVERYAALGFSHEEAHNLPYVPLPKLESAQRQQEHTLRRLKLSWPEQPVLALCPGAEYGPAKRWPSEYYATVARQAIERGYLVWLLGSPNDQPVAQAVAALVNKLPCRDLTGRTTLEEAIDILALSHAVVSNDSGLMHIAAALDKPMVALFGSSNPAVTPPLSQAAHVLTLKLPCSPCLRKECPKKHLQCLRGITPEEVLTRLVL